MASLNPSVLNLSFGKTENDSLNGLKGTDSIATTLAQQITNVAMANTAAEKAAAVAAVASSVASHVGTGSLGDVSGQTSGTGSRRRPALQCHKCKHCAAPDCAK